MADELKGRRTRSAMAMSRRAKLRKQAIGEMRAPETLGPESNVASLVWVGMPAGAASKAVKAGARLAPKGFRIVEEGTKTFRKHILNKLKPILGKSVRGGK